MLSCAFCENSDFCTQHFCNSFGTFLYPCRQGSLFVTTSIKVSFECNTMAGLKLQSPYLTLLFDALFFPFNLCRRDPSNYVRKSNISKTESEQVLMTCSPISPPMAPCVSPVNDREFALHGKIMLFLLVSLFAVFLAFIIFFPRIRRWVSTSKNSALELN